MTTATAPPKRYISIHEDCIDLLRPTATTSSVAGFRTVARVAAEAAGRAKESGNQDQRYFCWRLGEVAELLANQLEGGDAETKPIDLPAFVEPPRGTDALLFGAMKRIESFPPAECTRIAKSAAAGELDSLVLRVDTIHDKGGEKSVKRAVVAVWCNQLPEGHVVWINDATASYDELKAIVPGLIDATPEGRIEKRHPEIQLPNCDVKQSSAPSRVVAVVRAMLEHFPEYPRVGIVAHRKHIPTIDGTARKGPVLENHYRQRITKLEYFRSGQSRGSNEWLSKCDCIFVVGTPRVPPTAVRTRLIQNGNHLAAKRDGLWGRDWWSGLSADGKRYTIKTAGYMDHDWRAAYMRIVGAELLQSIGRGRAILDEGMPVYVASNEPLELEVRPDITPLTDGEAKVLQAVRELTDQNSKGLEAADYRTKTLRDLLGFRSVSSEAVASHLSKGVRPVRRLLSSLSERGLVTRIGERKGWSIPESISTTAPHEDRAGRPAGGP